MVSRVEKKKVQTCGGTITTCVPICRKHSINRYNQTFELQRIKPGDLNRQDHPAVIKSDRPRRSSWTLTNPLCLAVIRDAVRR
jgi:hypothetical protein